MKYALQATALTLAITLALGAGLAQNPLQDEQPQPSVEEGVEWEGTVTARMYDDQGDLVWKDTQKNTLTHEGENYFRSLAQGDVSNGINYIALSNASSYEKNKDHNYLQGEVTCCNLTRQETTIQDGESPGEWSLLAVWTAGDSVEGVKAAGLFPHDVQGSTTNDDNILVAEATMADKAFREDYRFELEWNIQMSS